jgi:YVTN family beta-propeller protein
MKINTRQIVTLAAIVVPLLAKIPDACAAAPYKLLTEIPVGGDGGWDYLSIDEAARRLYMSHATEIVVIDIDRNAVVGRIADTPGVHGFAVAPDLGRGFSSNGKEAKSSIVDLKTLKTLSKVDTGENPDAILYEPMQREVYTFNGHGQSATVFDAATGKVAATIPLGGKPEFAVIDRDAKLIYNNLEDKSAVAVIDPTKHQVVNTWPIKPGEEASGMAFDAVHHRLFLGCANNLMAMMDSTTGKVVATVPIGKGVDANAFDPATQLAFSSCGDGTVTIAHEDTLEKLTVVQTLATQRGARTMTLDSKTHRIYLAAAKFEDAPPQAPGAPRQRPKIVPGSVKVLVYAMDEAFKGK